MRISELEISNFKAVRELKLSDLGDVIVVAGPNGCGKSCILDAIRFLKSIYAGYRQQNEWHQFFGEFQLNMQSPDEVRRLFFDRSRPVTISAAFVLSDEEKVYIKQNVKSIIQRNLIAQQFGGEAVFHNRGVLPPDFNKATDQARKVADKIGNQIIRLIDTPVQTAKLTLDTMPAISVEPNPVLQFVFSIYDPVNIGIIDYHSANRTYQRERLGGINVNIEETSQRLAQHALYNWQSKYTNIKSELAAAYIRDIFVERAGGETSVTPSILKTMTELFEQFLPGKEFKGPVPGQSGELTFPVKLDAGGEHDIDDLSSGEKELVYGYLRLRNVSPTNSIILLDEPELHLNPRLVLGLPSFYRQHLGLELGNQLWMTTHSDAFLRDAYKGGGFTIFHMSPAHAVQTGQNQAVPISADNEVNRAIVDLVGDIAGFRPGNIIVVFESSENANFDASMTKRLFPEFAETINSLSGDNKFGVRQLYAALNKAVAQMGLPYKIYAIVDRDSDVEKRSALSGVFSWDVYHIENYLLEVEFIEKVLIDNPTYSKRIDRSSVEASLKECARESFKPLIRHRMNTIISAELFKSFDLGFDLENEDPARGFSESLDRVNKRINELRSEQFNPRRLSELKASIESSLENSLTTDDWKRQFRGRDILKRFAGKFLTGLPYEAFRDAIVARMGDAGHRPAGMKAVIESIIAASKK